MKATKAKNGGGGGSAVRGIGIKPGASGATSHATASHFGYPTGNDDDNDGSDNGNEDEDDDEQDEDQEEEKQIPKQQNKKHSTNLASKKSSSFNSSMQSSNSSNTNTARGKANSMAVASRIQSDEENAGTVISKVFHEEKVLLIENMKSKEGFFESSGLLVINEDEKDIKGATANVKKMILSIFGDAGIYLEKLIRKLNWVYLFQGFPGIFPVLTWKDRFLDPMDSVNSTYEDIPKDMCIPWGKSLVDFFCGTSKEEFTQSIFNGVCSQRMSQIAMRYFLVARVVTSDVLTGLNITLPGSLVGCTENEQIQRLFYPWIKYHIQGSKATSLANGGRGLSIKDDIFNTNVYKDIHCNLGRLHGSMCYKIKAWLASIPDIMYGLSGVGMSIGSFGIDLNDRAKLRSDVVDLKDRNFSRTVAFGYVDNSEKPIVQHQDILMPLPGFTEYYLDTEVSHLLTDVAKEANQERNVYIEKSIANHLLSLEVQEDGEYSEPLSPVYFHPPTDRQFIIDYAYSAYFALRFFKICGLGALKCASMNETHPYSLSEAAKFAFKLEDAVDVEDEPIEDVYNLTIKVCDNDVSFKSWLNSDQNSRHMASDAIVDDHLLNSIPGGVLSDFFISVKISNALKDHCMDENGDWIDDVDFSPLAIRNSFMFGSYGTGLQSPADRHEWSMFKYHPLVNLLRIIAWNPKGCCPPMHEFTTAKEFFNIFQPQFLGKSMALLAVATQFPEDFKIWMSQIDPVGPNHWLKDVFTSFIEPEVVLGFQTLFDLDYEFLEQYDDSRELKFMYGLIGALAPNSNMLQANFGRSTSKDKSTNKISKGQQLQEAMHQAPIVVKKVSRGGSQRAKFSIMDNIPVKSSANANSGNQSMKKTNQGNNSGVVMRGNSGVGGVGAGVGVGTSTSASSTTKHPLTSTGVVGVGKGTISTNTTSKPIGKRKPANDEDDDEEEESDTDAKNKKKRKLILPSTTTTTKINSTSLTIAAATSSASSTTTSISNSLPTTTTIARLVRKSNNSSTSPIITTIPPSSLDPGVTTGGAAAGNDPTITTAPPDEMVNNTSKKITATETGTSTIPLLGEQENNTQGKEGNSKNYDNDTNEFDDDSVSLQDGNEDDEEEGEEEIEQEDEHNLEDTPIHSKSPSEHVSAFIGGIGKTISNTIFGITNHNNINPSNMAQEQTAEVEAAAVVQKGTSLTTTNDVEQNNDTNKTTNNEDAQQQEDNNATITPAKGAKKAKETKAQKKKREQEEARANSSSSSSSSSNG